MKLLTIKVENSHYSIDLPDEDFNRVMDFFRTHNFSLEANNSLEDLISVSFHDSYAQDLQILFTPLKYNNLDHIILICIKNVKEIIKDEALIKQCIANIDHFITTDKG